MADSVLKDSIDQLIGRALEEDVGSGDITTRNLVDPDRVQTAEVVARDSLVLCGTEIFKRVFHHLDPQAEFLECPYRDGDPVPPGGLLFRLRAKTVALLEGERVGLNLLQRLSGIATLTRRYVDQARPVTILDTRKTTPGLRRLEKYAVRCGGGTNHRFGLFDAVLIKDNHIKAAGGIIPAVARIRQKLGADRPVEVEATQLEEVRQALTAGADTILLDNMSLETIREAVKLIDKKAKIEVSGGVTLERLKALAPTGIDFISVGALTHSAPAVDVSMNLLEEGNPS